MKRAGHVACVWETNDHNILVGEPFRKRQLGRQRCEGNIRM